MNPCRATERSASFTLPKVIIVSFNLLRVQVSESNWKKLHTDPNLLHSIPHEISVELVLVATTVLWSDWRV